MLTKGGEKTYMRFCGDYGWIGIHEFRRNLCPDFCPFFMHLFF